MKKRLLTLALCAVLAAAFAGCSDDREEEAAKAQAKAWNSMTEEEQMTEYYGITRECLELRASLGEDSPYPAFWRNASMRVMKGETVTEAVSRAKEAMMQTYAVYDLGSSMKIASGKEQVEPYIQEKILDAFGELDDTKAADEAAEAAGTTFEDSVWAYYDSYRQQYVMSQIPDFDMESLKQCEADFRETDSGKQLEQVLDVCEDMFRAGVQDSSELKGQDIYFEQ